MVKKLKREVMCKDCMAVFTTRDRRRFKCYKCEPVPGTEPKRKKPPRKFDKKEHPDPLVRVGIKMDTRAGSIFKDEFDKLEGLK
jgi:hypothetical protein